MEQSEKELSYSELLELRKAGLAKLEFMYDVLSKRYEHDKEEMNGEHINLLPFFCTLVECSPYSTTKMIKPLLRAYRRAVNRQKKVVDSYTKLSRLENK